MKRKIVKVVLFIILCMGINWSFQFILTPPSYVRLDLNHIYEQDNKYDQIFIGTSHGQYGIDPESVDQITGKTSMNLCMADQYPIDTYYLLRDAFRNQKPEKIIYELDPSYFMTEQRVGSPKVFIFKEMEMSLNKLMFFDAKLASRNFRATLFPWIYYRNLLPDAPENLKVKLSDAYKEYDTSTVEIPLCYYKGEGFIYRNYYEQENKGTFNNIPWDESQVKQEALYYFEKIVELCEDEGTELEVIVTPVPKETIAHTPENYRAADQYFQNLTEGYGVQYHNFNELTDAELDRSMEGYWDYDGHMYGAFAGKFSSLLGKHLSD